VADTSVREHEAETRVAHELLRHGILVAKPYFDRRGADLLAMVDVDGGARFIPVQCKGRSLEGSESTSVRIPKSYVGDDFAVFLYLRHPDGATNSLYLFFADDIRRWHEADSDKYVLSIGAGTFKGKLAGHLLTSETISRLTQRIQCSVVPSPITSALGMSPGVIWSDGATEVTLEKDAAGVHHPIVHDLATRTKRAGTTCPGDPSDMRYDPHTDTWRCL